MMDWAAIQAALQELNWAFIGVLVGVLITWLMQERMFNRQRDKELDDQWRQWQLEQLTELSKKVKHFNFTVQRYREAATDSTAFQKTIREIHDAREDLEITLAPLMDDQLHSLYYAEDAPKEDAENYHRHIDVLTTKMQLHIQLRIQQTLGRKKK